MKTCEHALGPIQRYQFPLLYDVKNDPGEEVELMSKASFQYSWVYAPMGKILSELPK